jgi:hypothetical protein
MVGRIIRVVLGFLVASFVAGLVLVLFVNTPAEMPDWPSERYAETGMWALAVGTQVAIFASTFAFIGAVYAEWRGIASATYSIILGLLIAMIAFASHYAGEGSGGDVSTYALSAFIVTGIVAGYVYWYVSGRFAGAAAPAAPAEGVKA